MSTSPSAPGAVPPPGCPAHTGSGGGRSTDGGRTAEPLHGPEFAADPAATYARLRAYGSVAPVELAPGVHASLVTGYETALEVLRSPERFAKDPRRWRALADGTVPADSPVVPMMMYRPNALWTDGDEHARLRGAISDSLSRVDPNALRGYVEQSADTLIDTFGPRGRADLLGEYGAILPLLVFNQLFGCPPDLGEKLVEGMSGIFDANADSEKANALLAETLGHLVALKRARPGADVTTWLMEHPARLTDEEMIHQLVVLMGGGTEPQQNLICNGLRLLLSDDRFAGDLAGGSMLVEDALDDVLWKDPPLANYAIHYPIRDTHLGGARLREGEPILVSLAAANTDPALASERRGGNRAHLAWSAGPHTCPAKDPARLIAAVAVEKLLDRLPDVELAVGVEQLEWRQGPFHRALAALPVKFPPVALPAAPDETPGASGWNTSPAPSSSIPQATTSTAREPVSENRGPSRWWSSLARWWRGQ
ncbi:cytochrome P450 [Streptomyces sp. 8N706]|uniref:cytochrome P450 n=1 Tax=Streptomyces sp. 8N706 TaxID=3457416 RepID=UPI003FD576A4